MWYLCCTGRSLNAKKAADGIKESTDSSVTNEDEDTKGLLITIILRFLLFILMGVFSSGILFGR